MNKVKVGIIGCGSISGIYMKNLSQLFEGVEVAACADLDRKKAEARAAEFGIPGACTVEELLAMPELGIVVNLTVPSVHAEINIRALEAGKNVYVEKPLAITREDGLRILELAAVKGLLVGSAPDTFMGAGLQTCRRLLDEGRIGRPVAAAAFMTGHGPEGWHPDPEFFYKAGAGPMFDMGPYYLTALVSLLGPVKRVTGSASVSFPEREITSPGRAGEKIRVEIPTHIAGSMDFESGAVGTIVTSFDVWSSRLPMLEIYGSEGTLSLPDPNTFGGPVLVRRKEEDSWSEAPLTHKYGENSRGLGVADMAASLASGRPHRAGGGMACHVLEIMHGFHKASEESRHYFMKSTCERPEALSGEELF